MALISGWAAGWRQWLPTKNVQGVAESVAISSAVSAALAICAIIAKGVPLCLSRMNKGLQLLMTATAAPFVLNAAGRACTPAAFAQNATSRTVDAATV